MDSMKDRIKLIREQNKLSQEDFGNRIKIKRSAVSKIESGLNNPSDQTIALICSEFSINENWLRTGDGEMFSLQEDEEAAYVSELLEDTENPLYDLIKAIMKTYSQTGEKEKAIIKAFAKDLHKNLKEESRD